jgi:exopolysaccharide production protein ExoQ
MPPQLALLICIIIILYLFWVDRKKVEGVSRAIWIPIIWMFLDASRYVSQWLGLGTPNVSADALLEGSPVDRAVFTGLIIAGLLVLRQRKISWTSLFTKNPWIWLYFVFGALSFIWSDYPFVSFKRWIKGLGNVVMILVVLTEERPYLAIGVILRRLAFLLLPLSVLFIKYYPELGRAYHMGRPMYTGVGFQKNALGQICLLSGVYFSWNLLLGRRVESEPGHRLHYSVYFLILPMITWLLYMANSATSLACTIVAIGIFVVGRQPAIENKPQRILYLGIGCAALFAIMEYAFGVKDSIIFMLGRNPDLTGRHQIWENYLALVRNPIVGYGYESFYLSVQLQDVTEQIRSTHNGYLEMYLNLGIIGVLFVLGWILSGLRKVHRQLGTDYPAAMLRLGFIAVVTLYSWTEATFAGVSNMWSLLLFAAMSIPGKEEVAHSLRKEFSVT